MNHGGTIARSIGSEGRVTARIILGIGSSHSPALNNVVESWLPAAGEAWDRPRLAAAGLGDFDELARQKASWIPQQITEERVRERYDACHRAIDALSETLNDVAPDVLVVVGDDHHEVFPPTHMPAFDVHWADSMLVLPFQGPVDRGKGTGDLSAHVYPGEADLAEHLVASLVAHDFDPAYTRTLEPGQSLGHTYDYVCRRLMRGRKRSLVPILLNTYYPPNTPTVSRCYAMGRSLRRAIESWDTGKTVGIIASGGLTHMIIDEEMDRAILQAIHDRNEAGLTRYPEQLFVDGTSEIKGWVVLAGAMEVDEREMQLVDYRPCYRSPAGTGCGMAFAYWR